MTVWHRISIIITIIIIIGAHIATTAIIIRIHNIRITTWH